ncbi:hypothetical protein KZZ52_37180 [Dactylosporangium sp. AC04546]|uniref:hypothetical protein n=1 Tax=Dactylosporangium sp. AC04546 TaxID=2862460 RepID=UPI001EDDA426|nr:hypothetical protein [Dactylosporangium sp. AC04546]WVK79600.1 hypothetical protein KZZ52_37180 [Dactylosporangium sp. AC04546]
MSNPGHPPVQPAAVAAYVPTPPTRPATLTFGFLGALLAGLFSAVGSALLIVKAHDLAERTASDVLGEDAESLLGSELTAGLVDEAANTLVVRGVTGLVPAVLVLGIALAVRNGALWARIVLTVLLLGALCANGLVISDVAPGATKALGVAAIVLSVAVVVLLFLPPTNRYARARRQRVA